MYAEILVFPLGIRSRPTLIRYHLPDLNEWITYKSRGVYYSQRILKTPPPLRSGVCSIGRGSLADPIPIDYTLIWSKMAYLISPLANILCGYVSNVSSNNCNNFSHAIIAIEWMQLNTTISIRDTCKYNFVDNNILLYLQIFSAINKRIRDIAIRLKGPPHIQSCEIYHPRIHQPSIR